MYIPVVDKSSKHYGSNFWNCKSYKINRDVHFYNDLEYEYWIHIETNPRIIDFCEKPLKVERLINNKIYESIVDMWLKWECGKEEFVKVSYKKDTLYSDSTKRGIQIQAAWCKENNYNHRIVTEEKIRVQPLFTNLKSMMPYIKDFKSINEILIFKIMNYIDEKPQTFQNLLKYLEPIGTHSFYQSIFYLFYNGQIEIDINDNAFNLNSKVWLINGKV